MVRLATNTVEYLHDIRSWSLAENEKNSFLLCRSGKQENVIKLMNLKTHKEQRYTGVEQYWVNNQASTW